MAESLATLPLMRTRPLSSRVTFSLPASTVGSIGYGKLHHIKSCHQQCEALCDINSLCLKMPPHSTKFPISSSSLGLSVGGVGSGCGVLEVEVAGDGAGTLGLGVATARTGFPIKSSCFLSSNFSSSSISASKTNFLFRT